MDSGVRVLTESVPGVRSISLGIWIDSGSRDEAAGERGLTHFLEHLIFKGTPSMGARQISEAFDNMGADINAVTGKEHSSVYSRVIDEYLPRAVEIIMDMIENPLLDPKEIDSERQVVLEEIAMHADSPDELVHDYLAKIMWGDHPLGHMVLGESGVIRTVHQDSLDAYHGERYVATRTVVAAAGAVDHRQICGLISDKIGLLPVGEPAVRDDALSTPFSANQIIKKETEQAHICMGSKGLPRAHPDRFALAVMDNILGGSMSSRLFQHIREERGLAYSIYSYNGMFIGMGMVGIYCGTHPSQAQKVINLIEDELVKVRMSGFTSREMDRSKNHIKGSLIISNEDSGSRMSRIAKAELSGREHLTIDEIVERVERVSLEDLDRVFEESWGGAGVSLAVIGPFDEGTLNMSGRI